MRAAQIQLIGFKIARIRFDGRHTGKAFAVQQTDQIAYDCCGDTALRYECIGRFAFENPRPEHAAILRGGQLNGGAQPAGSRFNRSIEDCVNAELAAGFKCARVCCRERVRRRAAGDFQALHMGERIGNLVRKFDADIPSRRRRRRAALEAGSRAAGAPPRAGVGRV